MGTCSRPCASGADGRCRAEKSSPRHSHPPEHRHSIAGRCHKIAAPSTIDIVSRTQSSGAPPKRHELYETAAREYGHTLNRLAVGHEADRKNVTTSGRTSTISS